MTTRCKSCGQSIPEPLSPDEIKRVRLWLESPRLFSRFVFSDPFPIDEAAAERRIAKRLLDPDDDLSKGVKL